MEVSQSYNFTVSSSRGDYKVFFTSVENSIDETFSEGDVIICDHIFHSGLKQFAQDRIIPIVANEKAKDFSSLSPIISKLIELSFDRKKKLIAVGGGVIQDITAFIASVLFRGVEWVFYPTTLLAQGDSCIGSKSSINFEGYKNQIGTFYPPSKIIIDVNFLNELPEDQLLSGFGEMTHYFLIELDEHYEFFKENFPYNDQIEEIIYRSLQIKKEMIEKDEFDQGERIIFNYGHSFGHAIESLTNYQVPHGIAVANGMDMANYFSFAKGWVSKEQFEEYRKLISNFWDHPAMNGFFNWTDHDVSQFFALLQRDKKSTADKIGLILPVGEKKEYKLLGNRRELLAFLKSYSKLRTHE